MLNRRQTIAGSAVLALSSGIWAHVSPERSTQIVQTTSGSVRGLKNTSGISVFKGVRYGEDTAHSRFAKPVIAQARTELFNADGYGAASPQRGDKDMSEDCLFLNIWTPGPEALAKRPVMVYFHGGAYASGSGSDELYDGTNLAVKGDVVVVTVNHRLNAFGYLYLDRIFPGQFPDSGNAGQWDLVLALEWIKTNITQFGGDPERVMVFGQSGGGAKIATLMASPAAEGLFHAAATMSGQQVTACGPLNGTERAKRFLSFLGPDIGPESLRSMPYEALIPALSQNDPINEAHRLYFGPVLDERMLKRHPFWPDAPSQSKKIPMILGNTLDETKAFLWRPEAFELTWTTLPAWLSRELRCDISPDEVIKVYRELFPDYSPTDVMFAATTAGRSWRGQVEEADARARQKGPTWVYQFNLPSPQDGGARGAPHTIDIAHAFDNLDKKGAMSGQGPAARRVADQLSKAFIHLARFGDPNHDGLPDWQEYRLPDRQTMVFDARTKQMNDPRKAQRELFAKVPFIQWGT